MTRFGRRRRGRDQVGDSIWDGEAEPPWEYRANRWERAAGASLRRGCQIKGNVTSTGEKIYHTPWSPWYDRTRIDESAGERWFCDEAEAQAAGCGQHVGVDVDRSKVAIRHTGDRTARGYRRILVLPLTSRARAGPGR